MLNININFNIDDEKYNRASVSALVAERIAKEIIKHGFSHSVVEIEGQSCQTTDALCTVVTTQSIAVPDEIGEYTFKDILKAVSKLDNIPRGFINIGKWRFSFRQYLSSLNLQYEDGYVLSITFYDVKHCLVRINDMNELDRIKEIRISDGSIFYTVLSVNEPLDRINWDRYNAKGQSVRDAILHMFKEFKIIGSNKGGIEVA